MMTATLKPILREELPRPGSMGRVNWARILSCCVAIVLGAAQAWCSRFAMNADGVSYLDMGEAYFRGDWKMAINAYWSPLYSWILAAFLKIFRPTSYWQFPAVHLANFVIYLGALICFDFFLTTFLEHRRELHDPDEREPLPDWMWWLFGYSVFMSSSLLLITVIIVTPDMCVAALVYLASALLLKIQSGECGRKVFALFGVVLGVAYLAKTVMFPLAFVFLGIMAVVAHKSARQRQSATFAFLLFAIIALPFVLAISLAQKHPTIGESGRMNYAFFVNGVDPFIPTGSELHNPVHTIADSPRVYEYARPVGGTYPIWYDPSYWHDGIKIHFDLGRQRGVVEKGLLFYGWLVFAAHRQLCLTVGLTALYLLQPRPFKGLISAAKSSWTILLPSLTALSLYALVYTEFRYIAPFACLIWMVAFSGSQRPPDPAAGGYALIGVCIALVTCYLIIGRTVTAAKKDAPTDWEAAMAIRKLGVLPGEKMAVVSERPFEDGGAFVARLAGLQIIAETREVRKLWSTNDLIQSRLLKVFANAGANAVLFRDEAIPKERHDWVRLAGTNYYMYLLGPSNHQDMPGRPDVSAVR